MVTVQLDAGRKQKLRAGDILGALTGTLRCRETILVKSLFWTTAVMWQFSGQC
jgi:hypothetical protein